MPAALWLAEITKKDHHLAIVIVIAPVKLPVLVVAITAEHRPHAIARAIRLAVARARVRAKENLEIVDVPRRGIAIAIGEIAAAAGTRRRAEAIVIAVR